MLVPVRETVSVPMLQQNNGMGDKKSYIFAGIGSALALALSGLTAAAIYFFRRRKQSQDSKDIQA
jgi:hypothetical protein